MNYLCLNQSKTIILDLSIVFSRDLIIFGLVFHKISRWLCESVNSVVQLGIDKALFNIPTKIIKKSSNNNIEIATL